MQPWIEKLETQNRRFDMTGWATPSDTLGLMGTGPGLDPQEALGRVFERFWNWTEPCFQSKLGPLADYPDPLITLPSALP